MDWWEDFYSNTKYVISSPARWDKGDWIKFSFVTITTSGLMTQDEWAHDFSQAKRSFTSDKFSSVIEPFGSEGAVLAIGGMYLCGCLMDNTNLKKTATLGAQSIAISSAAVLGLKFLIGRACPYKGEDAFSYSPFNMHACSQSLPSGHTSAAFSVASCVATQYKNPIASALLYGTATLVGLSRINANRHWMSDVFAGSIIGISVGRTIAKLHQ